jgi:hypothetical protein
MWARSLLALVLTVLTFGGDEPGLLALIYDDSDAVADGPSALSGEPAARHDEDDNAPFRR